MRRSGSITVKLACFISTRSTSKHSSYTPIIRPDTSIIRQTRSGSGHATTSPDYLREVAESVSDAGAVLITGPANAKTELAEYIHLHVPKLGKAIAGIETVDHPSDAKLVAYARKYLTATDRMQP
jgi:hypothetical protein